MSRANDPAHETDATLSSVSGRYPLTAREKYLLGALFALLLTAVLAPALPAAAWHIPHFVDTSLLARRAQRRRCAEQSRLPRDGRLGHGAAARPQ